MLFGVFKLSLAQISELYICKVRKVGNESWYSTYFPRTLVFRVNYSLETATK